MKSCLIISPYFPPSSLAGVHRARHLAKHLPAAGWTPTIVCVDEKYHEQSLDPGLASLVPSSVDVVKVAAVPVEYCRHIGLGDISLRAWRQLRQVVLHLLETRAIQAVLITGSPYYPMLLTNEIRRRFSIPVVLDFQDPWVSAWGATQNRLSKPGLAHRLAAMLEPQATRTADFITAVSETQNAEMRARYPWLCPSRMAALPIGGDPEDYAALRAHIPTDGSLMPSPEYRTLAYVGTFMPRSSPVMKQVLKAFALARSRNADAMENVRLLFVGTSNQPDDTSTFSVLPLARAIGLSDGVEERPQRVPYLDALSILARSDGILLLGSDEPHYTASKIYPGLMSGRPYLSVFHRASSAHQILAEAGGGIALAFNTQNELEALPSDIAEALVRLVTKAESVGRADPSVCQDFSACAIASRFAAIFDQVSLKSRVRRESKF